MRSSSVKFDGSPLMYKLVVLKLSDDEGGLAGFVELPAAAEYCCCCCCYTTNYRYVSTAGFPWDI